MYYHWISCRCHPFYLYHHLAHLPQPRYLHNWTDCSKKCCRGNNRQSRSKPEAYPRTNWVSGNDGEAGGYPWWTIVALSHPDSPTSATLAIYGIIRTKGFASPTDKPTLPQGGLQGGLDVSSQLMAAYASLPQSSRPSMSNLSFSPFGLPDPNVCCVHNKKRGPRNLQPSKTVPGMSECRPEDPCKGASNPAPPQYNSGMFADTSADLMNLYGAMPAAARTPVRFNPYARADPTICVVHNKKRGARNLQDSKTVPGAFECLPEDQCKGAGAPAVGGSPDGSQAGVCVTHGKKAWCEESCSPPHHVWCAGLSRI